MLKKASFALILLAVLGLVLAPVAAVAQEKVIKIGSMFPMTGRPGQYGLDSVDAAEMAVEEINAAGGVAGYKLEFLNTDTKAKPDYAVRVTKRYITEDKVHFLFGVVSSAVGLAVTEISKQVQKDLHRHGSCFHTAHYGQIAALLLSSFQQHLPVDGSGRSLLKGTEAD